MLLETEEVLPGRQCLQKLTGLAAFPLFMKCQKSLLDEREKSIQG